MMDESCSSKLLSIKEMKNNENEKNDERKFLSNLNEDENLKFFLPCFLNFRKEIFLWNE
jgi:hypothetical protein